MSSTNRQFRYEHGDFCVLRTPLLPVDELLRWGADLESPGATDDALEEALERDYARLTERLRAVVARPDVREALYLASPELFERLCAWEGDTTRDADGRRITRAVVRYFTRMASRATPFGLFAGVGIGSIGRETRLAVSTGAVSRHIHLDMGYLEGLMVRLEQDPAVRARLRYQANTSISHSAGRLHYVETRHEGDGRVYTLAAVDASPEVCAVLRRCEQPTSLVDIAAVLISEDVDADEATSFVLEMVDAQLLVSDLEPAVTGSRSLDDLCSALEAVDAHTASVLSNVALALRDIEAAPLGVSSEAYARVCALLGALPVSSDVAQNVFQVDMRLNADVTLGTSLVEEFARAGECLLRIGVAEPRPLDGFAKAFHERYDQQEIPLLEALDEEVGIGLPDEPPDPLKERARAAQQVAVTRLLVTALANDTSEIELTDADVDAVTYRGPSVDVPPGYSVMGTISATDDKELRDGKFRVVCDSAVGPSGALLFGRFCHNDSALASAVSRQLAAEEAMNPEAIHAELVHLSRGRMGNVLARPVLRRYEIPFLGRSGAAADKQLRLDDLVVSVREGRIVLRSRRVGREVIPHLTNAHNADLPDSPRVYRFLAHFQRQSNRYVVGWPWGSLMELPFLPRVAYGRTVLSRARWTFGAHDIANLVRAQGAARVRAVQALRDRSRLPRFVQLKDGDQTLFVDFDNPMCVDVLVDLVKRRQSMTLVELLPTPADTAVTSVDGKFSHEIIVPFVRRPLEETSAPPSTIAPLRSASRPGIRRFPPGSECLYAKLYSGIGIADGVLRDVVSPLVQQVLSCGAADRWFFIRYIDPHPHIRLRFFGDPGRLASEVLPALNVAAEPFIRDGRIWRVQLDTYEREVERYGGTVGVELAERLFAADSAAALAIIRDFGGTAHEERRAMLTMSGIDRLLTDFGVDSDQRVALLARTTPDMTDFHRQQGEDYRRVRAALEPVLAGAAVPDLESGLAALERRSAEIAPIAAAIRAGLASGTIHGTAEQLLLSYTHMFVNRVEALEANRAERRYYDFIRRFHTGRLARANGRTPARLAREETATALAY